MVFFSLFVDMCLLHLIMAMHLKNNHYSVNTLSMLSKIILTFCGQSLKGQGHYVKLVHIMQYKQ